VSEAEAKAEGKTGTYILGGRFTVRSARPRSVTWYVSATVLRSRRRPNNSETGRFSADWSAIGGASVETAVGASDHGVLAWAHNCRMGGIVGKLGSKNRVIFGIVFLVVLCGILAWLGRPDLILAAIPLWIIIYLGGPYVAPRRRGERRLEHTTAASALHRLYR
jgi:hypothetical protein